MSTETFYAQQLVIYLFVAIFAVGAALSACGSISCLHGAIVSMHCAKPGYVRGYLVAAILFAALPAYVIYSTI